MNINDYCRRQVGKVHITAVQASRFAKTVAADFNPIHDPGAQRFCVPGDLLFVLALAHYCLSREMKFDFRSMVGEDAVLQFPTTAASPIEILDDRKRCCLRIDRQGERLTDERLALRFGRQYVAFSGHNFPHILVPLMAEKGVMINPDRPMVLYLGMHFHFQHLNFNRPDLTLVESKLAVEGKRGNVRLRFSIEDGDRVIGSGEKFMVLSGLRPYDQDSINSMVQRYEQRKQQFSEGK